jgi:hypothetical protein
MISRSDGGQRVELVAIVEEAEVVNRGMLRHVDDRAADRTRSSPRGNGRGVALEVREELGAALVLVDAADVDRERPLHPERAAGTVRVGPLGHVRSDADDHAGHRRVVRRPPGSSRALPASCT